MISEESIHRNHEVCLELLDRFIEICDKNKIDYYLAFGSCLGTVRHKGFIPWDINIDVLMRIEEYIRLDEVMKKEQLGNMKWSCPDGRIFCLLVRDDSYQFDSYPNIDISIYSNAPQNRVLRKIVFRILYYNIKMYKLKTTAVSRTFPFNVLKWVTELFPDSFYIGLVGGASRLIKKKTEYDMVLLPSIWDNREYVKRDWYGTEPTFGEFEGRKVKILKNYHEYLTMRYGNYMAPKVWENKGEYKHIKR